MNAQEWITLAGVAAAGGGVAATVAFRVVRDRHANLHREWSVLQSLADELRMNWELIGAGSVRPLYGAWLSLVQNRDWLRVKSDDYYDLLSLYTLLVGVTAEGGGGREEACAEFQELEPWVAAWWAHLQSEAERWRTRMEDRKSWRRWLAVPPVECEGPSYWEDTFQPTEIQKRRPSRYPPEVRQALLGQLADDRPWIQSIRDRLPPRQVAPETTPTSRRTGRWRWPPWSR